MPNLLKSLLIVSICLLCFSNVYAEEAGRPYYDLGVFAYEDGDLAAAEKYFKAALKSNPNDAFYNHYMGRTYMKMERYEDALNYLNKAWGQNPEISGLGYDLGYLHYKQGNYLDAITLFRDTAKKEPSNVLAIYYAGMSLFKEQQYREALDYLLSASELSPSVKANGYYYAGICYKEMGDLDKALEKMTYARDNTKSQSLMESASNWIFAINKQKRETTPYSLYFRLGYQFDDNVQLDPVDQDLYTNEDDSLAVGYLSGRYDILDESDLTMGVGYSHYQTMHNDLDTYDLMGSAVDLYATYKSGPFTYGFRYIPTYYWLDSDSYLRSHQLRPEIAWEVNRNLTARFSYRYYQNTYFQDSNKDSDTNEIYADIFRNLGKEDAYVNAALAYEINTADHPDEDFTQIKLKAAVSYPLPQDFTVLLLGKYYDQSYDNVDSYYGVTRKDAKYNLTLTLSHPIFFDWMSVAGTYSYTNNDSNINDYQYERTVVGLSLSAKF
jgi:tetratricopeptide (TPR) repeat protein